MIPPVPQDPQIARYLKIETQAAILQVPTADHLFQGILGGFLLVLLSYLLASLAIVSDPDTLIPALIGGTLLSGFFLVLVLGKMAYNIVVGRNRSTRIESDGALILPGGERLERGEVSEVFIGQPSRLLKHKGIGVRVAGGRSYWLIGRLPPTRARLIEGLARYVSEAIDAPVDIAGVEYLIASSFGLSAAACYFPIQGIWLIASIISLIFSKDPKVRFAAKQSLAFYLLSGLLVVLWGATIGGFAVIISEATRQREIAAVFAIVLIVVPALARIILGVMATFKAYFGKVWVIPGMGWIVRRWLPAP